MLFLNCFSVCFEVMEKNIQVKYPEYVGDKRITWRCRQVGDTDLIYSTGTLKNWDSKGMNFLAERLQRVWE